MRASRAKVAVRANRSSVEVKFRRGPQRAPSCLSPVRYALEATRLWGCKKGATSELGRPSRKLCNPAAFQFVVGRNHLHLAVRDARGDHRRGGAKESGLDLCVGFNG